MSEDLKSVKGIKEIPVSMIGSNRFNPDDERLLNLRQLGYVNFADEGTVDEDHVLVNLALSHDPNKRALYCKLIEEHEPDLAQLGCNIQQNGLLQPVEVRVKENAKMELVFGCRRFFATLYIKNKLNVPVGNMRIDAYVKKVTEEQAYVNALTENMFRKDMPKIKEARQMALMRQNGLTVKDIAEKMKCSIQTVQNRLDLADAPKEIMTKVMEGKMGITEATQIAHSLKQGGDPEELPKTQKSKAMADTTGNTPKRRVGMSFKEMQEYYDTLYSSKKPSDPEYQTQAEFFFELRKVVATVMKMSFKEAENESKDRIARIKRELES